AMMQKVYRGQGPGLCVQVSRHSDGEIITRAIEVFGLRTARGSATRGAIASVRDLLTTFREGYDLAMAVDGPRGPYPEAKGGAVRIAQATGARLYPIAAAPRTSWRARSWDRFTVPCPFTRVWYAFGPAIPVARRADETTIEAARAELERELNR